MLVSRLQRLGWKAAGPSEAPENILLLLRPRIWRLVIHGNESRSSCVKLGTTTLGASKALSRIRKVGTRSCCKDNQAVQALVTSIKGESQIAFEAGLNCRYAHTSLGLWRKHALEIGCLSRTRRREDRILRPRVVDHGATSSKPYIRFT